MSEQIEGDDQDRRRYAPGEFARARAIVFSIAAFAAGVLGAVQLFSDSRVGGDADYIVGALRGVGWICLGILCGILGCALLLLAARRSS